MFRPPSQLPSADTQAEFDAVWAAYRHHSYWSSLGSSFFPYLAENQGSRHEPFYHPEDAEVLERRQD